MADGLDEQNPYSPIDMKTLLFAFALVLVCFSSTFWGCAKEDLGNLDTIFSDTSQNGPVTKMTAKVNDTFFNAIATDASLKPGQLTLTGVDANGKKIAFTIFNSSAGDYLVRAGATNNARFYPDSVTTVPFSSNASLITGGVVHIASIDTTNGVMSGDFNFISARTGSKLIKTVTEGVFTNISFTNATSTDPFSVKKNGRKWVPATVNVTVSGKTLTIKASDAANDTAITLTMPSDIVPFTKPYSLAQKGLYTASAAENVRGKRLTLLCDTTAAAAKKYRISPMLTILSNSGNVIQGNFSFVATFADPKLHVGGIVTTFNGGSFYLKY
jgi:hypothetical protein